MCPVRTLNPEEQTPRRSGGGRRPPPRRAAELRRRRAVALTLVVLIAAVTALVVSSIDGDGHTGQRTVARGRPSAHVRPAARPASQRGATSGRPARTGAAAGIRRSPASTPSGLFAARATTVTLVESASAGSDPTGPARRLRTVIRYPVAHASGATSGATVRHTGPFPLVVFSQGFDVSAESYAALLRSWSAAGYVVADPTYPRTDPAAPGGVDESDIVKHPADLRFVIRSVIAAARHLRSPFHGLVDPRRVAVIGHSDGGDVSLAVAADTCCRDTAVRAAVILSGAELGAFGGRYYGSGSVPLLVVQGSADTINVPGCSAQLYDQAPPPKYYLDIAGAEHQPPYLDPGPTRRGISRAVVAFLDAYLKGRRSPLRGLERATTLAGGLRLSSAPVIPATSTYCSGAP